MLYMSKQHQEGLVRLKYAVVSNKGGALLISENAGDGKTSLLAKLRQDLDQEYQGHCWVVFIDHPTLTANQMVGEIARQLGLQIKTTDKLTLLNDLRQFLLECHQNSEKCVVMLDEGQMLCHRPDLLQELRILLNFCVSDSFLLTFVLSGQKPLDEAIRAMPEFYQRLPVRFFLRNLNHHDTREMIRYRLRIAGNPPERDIFSEDGYTGIYNFSKGCPRIICSVADLALVIAHTRYSRQVDFVSVSQACSDMSRTDGAYHYYYFLKSFSEEGSREPGEKPLDQEARYCPKCGEEILEVSKYCQYCGANLGLDTLETVDRQAASQVLTVQQQKERLSDGEAETTAEIKEKKDKNSLPVQEYGKDSGEEGQEDFEAREDLDFEQTEPKKIGADEIECTFCGLVLSREVEECPNCGEKMKQAEDCSQETAPERAVGETVKEPEVKMITLSPAPPEEDFAESTEEEEKEGPDHAGKCPVCGASNNGPEAKLCLRCGSMLKGSSYEQDLLGQIERLSLRKYILSKNYLLYTRAPDPLGEELLFFPLGKLGGRSAVLHFSDGVSQKSFTTRCGLIFTSCKLRFVFNDGLQELDYQLIDDISVEEVKKEDTPLLYHLKLATASGNYRIMLPFRPRVAKRLSKLLRAYLSVKVRALAHVRAGQKNKQLEEAQEKDVS
ncbi:MAG TPA: AAA family ATPase [archaeon]|nr:AAA family ATPase [archaeon]